MPSYYSKQKLTIPLPGHHRRQSWWLHTVPIPPQRPRLKRSVRWVKPLQSQFDPHPAAPQPNARRLPVAGDWAVWKAGNRFRWLQERKSHKMSDISSSWCSCQSREPLKPWTLYNWPNYLRAWLYISGVGIVIKSIYCMRFKSIKPKKHIYIYIYLGAQRFRGPMEGACWRQTDRTCFSSCVGWEVNCIALFTASLAALLNCRQSSQSADTCCRQSRFSKAVVKHRRRFTARDEEEDEVDEVDDGEDGALCHLPCPRQGHSQHPLGRYLLSLGLSLGLRVLETKNVVAHKLSFPPLTTRMLQLPPPPPQRYV